MAVAFSGGADSTALLDLLFCERERYGITVCAVHINHGIRGVEAERDEAFCRAFCDERGIALTVRRSDIPALAARSGEGIEECARRVRYEIFEGLLRQGDLTRIATAHHAADNLETLLFRLVRGTGLRGAGGIPPVRGGLVRPALYAHREQIAEYIAERGLSYVVDSTNADTAYTRNRLRARVLPELEAVGDRLYDHVSSFCERVRADEEYLAVCAKKEKTDRIADLQALHRSIRIRVLELLTSDHGVTLDGRRLEALTRLVMQGRHGARITLSGTLTACVDRDRLIFVPEPGQKPVDFSFPLRMGRNDFPSLACTIVLSREELSQKQINDYRNIYKKSIHTCVKSDTISTMFIRARRPADAYRTQGMTRRVKKLLGQDKLTLAERDNIPVFCDGEGILWLPGHGVRDGAWTQDGTHIYYFAGV